MCSKGAEKERWLSTSTVARRLGVSINTVLNMIDSGKFNGGVRNIGQGSHLPRYQISKGTVDDFEQGIMVE